MKKILRLLSVVGVISLTALMTAGACDSSSSGSLAFTNTDQDLAKVSGNEILLKITDFPAAAAATAAQHFNTIVGAAATTRKRAFTVGYSGATGGMTLAVGGNVANAAAITTPAPAALAAAASSSDGVKVLPPVAAGMTIHSVFANSTAPTSAAEAAKDAAPFAFTVDTATATAGSRSQPVFWCTSTATGITAATPTATMTLAGGHTADCFVASKGAAGVGTAANATAYNAIMASNTFKKEVQIAFASISTGSKTLANLGLEGANDAAKLAAFADGLTAAEMALVVAANDVIFAKYDVKVVNDADFGE